jgi:hypothetical protein
MQVHVYTHVPVSVYNWQVAINWALIAPHQLEPISAIRAVVSAHHQEQFVVSIAPADGLGAHHPGEEPKSGFADVYPDCNTFVGCQEFQVATHEQKPMQARWGTRLTIA